MTVQDSLYNFQLFSLTHLITVAVLTAIWWQIIAWALQRRTRQLLIRLEKAIATVYLWLWIMFHGWWLLPANFDPATSLPIHICDIVALLLPLALIRRKRRLMALLYFWGLGFSLQGIVTPDLQLGLLSPLFWIFWLHHASIVGTAIYLVVVHQFRPTRKDFRWSVRAGLVYLALVLPVNIIWDFNYGYLGDFHPSQPSLIDWLGPWPWRVGVMAILAWLGMALLLAPWEWIRRKQP